MFFFQGLVPISTHQAVSLPGSSQGPGSAQTGSAFLAGVNSALLPGSGSPGSAHMQGNNLVGSAHMPGSGPTGTNHVQGSGLAGSAQSGINSPATGTVQHMAQSPLSRGELPGLLLGKYC